MKGQYQVTLEMEEIEKRFQRMKEKENVILNLGYDALDSESRGD